MIKTYKHSRKGRVRTMPGLNILITIVGNIVSLFVGISWGTANGNSPVAQVVLSIVAFLACNLVVSLINTIVQFISIKMNEKSYRSIYGSMNKEKHYSLYKPDSKEDILDRIAARSRGEEIPSAAEREKAKTDEYWKKVRGD